MTEHSGYVLFLSAFKLCIFWPRFFPAEKKLIVSGGARGTNVMLSGVPDEFEMISETESEIVFNVIGRYLKEIGGEIDEARPQR